MNNKNVTVLLMNSLPWLCLSFVFNLVVFSPIYFIFPVVKEILFQLVPVHERMVEIFYPVRDVPVIATIAQKSEQVAEVVLLGAWLYVAVSVSVLLLNLVREYLTYFLKAGHISVVGGLMRGEKVQNQLLYGVKGITSRVGSVNVMYVGDILTRKVVLEVNSLLFRDDGKMPDFVKRNRFLAGYMQRLIRAMLIHLDEVLLSYVMTKEGNVWKLYCDGLSKYLKGWKGVIKDSFKTVLLVSVLSGLLKAFVYLAVFVSMRRFDFVTLVLALALARYVMFCVKVTFLEAYEYIRMLIVFYEQVDKEEVDESILEKMKGFAPSLKKLLKRGGLKSTVSDISAEVQQGLSLDGVGLEELTQMAESKLVPDSLEYAGYWEKMKNMVKNRKERGAGDSV